MLFACYESVLFAKNASLTKIFLYGLIKVPKKHIFWRFRTLFCKKGTINGSIVCSTAGCRSSGSRGATPCKHSVHAAKSNDEP